MMNANTMNNEGAIRLYALLLNNWFCNIKDVVDGKMSLGRNMADEAELAVKTSKKILGWSDSQIINAVGMEWRDRYKEICNQLEVVANGR